MLTPSLGTAVLGEGEAAGPPLVLGEAGAVGAHEATSPVCLSICLKAHTAYRGPGGGGGSSRPQAAVDPTLLRSLCRPAGGATSPHGSVPSSLGGRFPQAVGSHVDDNMWKPLHILQDVRCPSGRLGLGTQGGPAFRALPGGPRSSMMTHQPCRSLGLGAGQGRGGSAPPSTGRPRKVLSRESPGS